MALRTTPPKSIEDLFEVYHSNHEKVKGTFVLAFLDDGTLDMTSFNVNFHGALMIQYMLQSFVDAKFTEMQQNGQTPN